MTYMPLMYIKIFKDFTNSYNEIIENLNSELKQHNDNETLQKNLINQIFVLIMMMLKLPNQK